MEKNVLEELVEVGKSTYEIAKELDCGQTNVRYWLRKFGLNTKYNRVTPTNVSDGFLNGRMCDHCGEELYGANSRFCSGRCKSKYYYSNHTNDINFKSNARQRKVSKERKLKLLEMSGWKCEVCGYCKNTAALTFHHVDPTNKLFTLDSRKLTNTNWPSILLEWEKCQLLCSNCHMEFHYPEHDIISCPGGI